MWPFHLGLNCHYLNNQIYKIGAMPSKRHTWIALTNSYSYLISDGIVSMNSKLSTGHIYYYQPEFQNHILTHNFQIWGRRVWFHRNNPPGSANFRCTFSSDAQTPPTFFTFLTLHHLSLLLWCFSGYGYFHMSIYPKFYSIKLL